MRLLSWLFGPKARFDVEELCRRLDVTVPELRAVRPAYRSFQIPKRTGGVRTILAPEPPLKQIQRRILHRLLKRLKAHPAAHGFEPRRSILTNATPHARRDVVVRLDIQDFFGSTAAQRVENYFRRLGWDKDAAGILATICTYEGALPQGAPTSPRLSNLLNARLDARLSALAEKLGGAYTRYADDITLSCCRLPDQRIGTIIFLAKRILKEEGYVLHMKKKLHVSRRHDRQKVTGLVVNERPALPRETRRWLRAVEHHLAQGRPATLTARQLQGWRALEAMLRPKNGA